MNLNTHNRNHSPRAVVSVYSVTSYLGSLQWHRVKPRLVREPRGCGLNRTGQAATTYGRASQDSQPKHTVNFLKRELMRRWSTAQAYGGVEGNRTEVESWESDFRSASLCWKWAGYPELAKTTKEICASGTVLDLNSATESGINNVTGACAEVRVTHSTRSAGKPYTRKGVECYLIRGRG